MDILNKLFDNPELHISLAEAKSAIAAAEEFIQGIRKIIKDKNPQRALEMDG